MAALTIPNGDKGYTIQFAVKDSAGNAKNLTDYYVILKVWVPGIPGALKVTGICTITDAVNGLASYTLTGTDFALTGTYQAELELTKVSGEVTTVRESTSNFSITVAESG
ncbi:BppU family phage baseplate upper protein [Dehalococcoides mccartyi]|uniref:BppU family phage baseplate upper protein n=1 Tax=Dehalococcoides mccartyi TaxID=61435 RepID=UPI0007503DCE|nr:BppU family phage baseplate upper protein [Dehalococcoides mccartyi]